jgi:hypothetical protein
MVVELLAHATVLLPFDCGAKAAAVDDPRRRGKRIVVTLMICKEIN